MKIMKKFASMLVLGTTVLTLSGCGMIAGEVVDVVLEKAMGDKTVTLVQGNIDAVYKGVVSEEYLELLTEGTEEDAEQAYLESMQSEADYFAYYWGMYDPNYGESYEDLSESVRADILQLCKDIFAQAKYEVQESTMLSDGNYSVKVSVEPIGIIEQAEELFVNNKYEPLNEFWEKYAEIDINTMSQIEYELYCNEYAEIIVQMVRELIPEMEYMEAKTQMIQLEEDEEGLLEINDDDWSIFNSYVVCYP